MKKLTVNLKQLITLLGDGNFHSGSALGEKLSITRSAIWKSIAQLQELGIIVESVKGKGYRLAQPLLLLDATQIEHHIQTTEKNKLAKLELLHSLPSTNDYLKEKLTLAQTAYICLAEQQSAGKGRMGRTWISPFGVNIYLSCLWQFQQDLSTLAGLSLVIGLAVVKTLSTCGFNDDFKLKWPNDILWQNKKLAGILIEISAETYGCARTIMGIGLNVNMLSDNQQEITQPWTSISAITGNMQDRNKIAGLLINQLLQHISIFERQGLAAFLPQWHGYDALLGKEISLQHGNDIISGVANGVNEYGQLLLKHADGCTRAYSSGDVSVRKLVTQ